MTIKSTRPLTVHKDTGVPPVRFYIVIIIVAIVIGSFSYIIGQRQGEKTIQLEYQDIIIQEQEQYYEIWKKNHCPDIDKCFSDFLQR